MELAALFALTARRTITLHRTAVVCALMTATHERRRTLLVAVRSTLRRALEISAGALLVILTLALTTAAHPRRQTLLVAILSTLRRRALELSTLTAWRERRAFAVGA